MLLPPANNLFVLQSKLEVCCGCAPNPTKQTLLLVYLFVLFEGEKFVSYLCLQSKLKVFDFMAIVEIGFSGYVEDKLKASSRLASTT